MELQSSGVSNGTLSAKNIGGIQETTVEFTPGVTLLVGRNATNRTSFLQAVMAALGSENVAIKGDTDQATVELTIDDETCTRQLSRQNGQIVTDGDPYLADPELADLFAFLLEPNEARRAVATGSNLRELIMRPVDTADIEAQIDDLVAERKSLTEELEEVESLKNDLPDLEAERRQLETQIEEKRAELEAKEAELEAADADVDETRAEKSELEDKLEELRSKRSQLDSVRYDLDTERESLEALKQEQQTLTNEYDDLPETPVGEIEELDTEIDRLRQQKQQLESDVNELQNVISFNEEMLNDADADAFTTLATADEDSVTDQLLGDDEVVCWTCGSEVADDQIEGTLDQLRTLSQTKVSEIKELDDQITELQSKKREYEQAQQERERIKRRLDDIQDDIEQTETQITTLQERREALTEEIETVEAAVEELEDEDFSAILDLHKEANQLEYELGSLETDLKRVEADITELEDRINEESNIKARREEIAGEIEALRTKITRIEETAVEEFNEHMDTVLELLDYVNLERVWIEKRQQEVKKGRRTVKESVFELHVIRTSDSGTVYEDTVDHLSESEREVTGLVFALAGYLAHEVYEELPFILLDSLEAIDAGRIAALIEYLIEHTEYLLVALLPEDAAQLPEEYDRVTEI